LLRISVSRARENLSEILGRVAYAKERIAIERRGKPYAVLIPVDDLDLLELSSGAADRSNAAADRQGSDRGITAHRRTEDALRLARFSLDRAGDAVVWIQPDGYVDYANETARRMLGYASDEWSALRINDIDPDVSPDSWPQTWERIKARSPYTFEARHRTKGGAIIPVEVSVYYLEFGGRELICSFSRDITVRKQAEEALQASQAETATAREQLIEALESISEGFVWYDADDRLVLFNNRFCEIYRQGAELVRLGARFEDIIRDAAAKGEPAAAVGRIEDWVQERLTAHRSESGPYEQLLSNGRWIQITERRLPDGGTVGIHADITRLKEAQEDLLRHERLAAIGQLTATVNHELRNPLGIIQTSVYLIDQFTRGKGLGVEPVLERANRGLQRCNEIIGELLDYTRLGKLQLQPLLVDSWLREILDEQSPPAGVALQGDLASGADIFADRERLRRVVINLLQNAYDALTDEKWAPIARRAPMVTVRSRSAAQRLEIDVIDSGPGIPPEMKAKVFEPLFSTKSSGVGLGLAIVKQIMEQHRGGVEIVDDVQAGARIILWLPLGSGNLEDPARYDRDGSWIT
jgi:prevent-host-death family protein